MKCFSHFYSQTKFLTMIIHLYVSKFGHFTEFYIFAITKDGFLNNKNYLLWVY